MKFIALSLIIIGIVLIFNLGGVSTPSGGYALRFYGDVTSDDDSGLGGFKDDVLVWGGLLAVVLVVGAVGARAGLFGSAPPISYYLGTLSIITLGSLALTDMLSIYLILWGTGEDWIRAIATLIFLPLSFAFIASLKSFWEGSDG